MSRRELYLVFSSRAPSRQLSLHGHDSFLAPAQGHRPYVQLLELTFFPDRHGLVCLSFIEMLPWQILEPASEEWHFIVTFRPESTTELGQTGPRDDVLQLE